MRYAKIREMDVSNGEGVGISLFVQGCHFHCKGCFNSETWDFNGGKEWTQSVKDTFLQLANRPYIQRISILGGEPLCDENVDDVLFLIMELKLKYPQKSIWLYTGYDFDEIMEKAKSEPFSLWNKRLAAISGVDKLVDGQFQIDKQDLYNEHIVFAGSTNQRIIDIKSTLEMVDCSK